VKRGSKGKRKEGQRKGKRRRTKEKEKRKKGKENRKKKSISSKENLEVNVQISLPIQ